MTPEERNTHLAIKKENRKLRKDLQSLSDSILLYVDWMDTKIGPEKSISKPVSSLIAKGINALVLVNDRVRYGSLGIDFRIDDKVLAVKKLTEAPGGKEVKNESKGRGNTCGGRMRGLRLANRGI